MEIETVQPEGILKHYRSLGVEHKSITNLKVSQLSVPKESAVEIPLKGKVETVSDVRQQCSNNKLKALKLNECRSPEESLQIPVSFPRQPSGNGHASDATHFSSPTGQPSGGLSFDCPQLVEESVLLVEAGRPSQVNCHQMAAVESGNTENAVSIKQGDMCCSGSIPDEKRPRIERPRACYPNHARRTSAPACLWSASSLFTEQVIACKLLPNKNFALLQHTGIHM